MTQRQMYKNLTRFTVSDTPAACQSLARDISKTRSALQIRHQELTVLVHIYFGNNRTTIPERLQEDRLSLNFALVLISHACLSGE